jgi:hypothetical protein
MFRIIIDRWDKIRNNPAGLFYPTGLLLNASYTLGQHSDVVVRTCGGQEPIEALLRSSAGYL